MSVDIYTMDHLQAVFYPVSVFNTADIKWYVSLWAYGLSYASFGKTWKNFGM